MPNYTTLDGHELEFEATPAEAAFLARAKAAAEDPTVSHGNMIAFVYGPENPILDTTTQPGRAIVTHAVFEQPLYHVFADLLGVKAVRLGLLDVEKAHAAYTIDVPAAAKELGITAQAVRSAIESRRLGSIFKKGQHWLRPESIASFKVSKAGRPRKFVGVAAVMGGSPGASLSVRVKGGKISQDLKEDGKKYGRFPEGWTSAAVRTTSETGTRLFLIVPVPLPSPVAGEILHGDLYVRGAFKVVRKVNDSAAASKEWKQFAEQAAA